MAVHGVVTCEFPIKEKVKDEALSGKVMCTVFWDKKGVILLDFSGIQTNHQV